MKNLMMVMLAGTALATSFTSAHAYSIAAQLVPPNSVPFTYLSLGTGDGLGKQSTASPIAVSGLTVTFSNNAGVYSGNVPNVVKSPFTDNTNYLAGEPNSSLTLTYATAQTAFNVLWGSVDTYNSLVFQIGGTTITGADILQALPSATPGVSNAAVEITGLPSFTSINVISTTAAFEMLPGVPVTGVPEPMSLAILGTGIVGLLAIRRKSSADAQA